MLRKEKTKQGTKDDQQGSARVNPQLILTCFGWSTTPLKQFLQHCKDFGRSFSALGGHNSQSHVFQAEKRNTDPELCTATESEVATTTTFTASVGNGKTNSSIQPGNRIDTNYSGAWRSGITRPSRPLSTVDLCVFSPQF